MKVKEIEVKSILNKSKIPGADYCLNPYLGCEHACVYCYARFMKKYTDHTEEWGDFVDIKVNAPEILQKQIARAKSGIVMLSSVCDPYQPLEKKHEITRKCLEILLSKQFPISILTKSSLVVRDIDLLKQFKEAEVGFSLNTLDERVNQIFQPGASKIKDRIDALKKVHENKICTYVFISPYLPHITDLEKLIIKVRPYVDFIGLEVLNMRKDYMPGVYKALRKHDPKLIEKYREIEKNKDQYWLEVEKMYYKIIRQEKIKSMGFHRHGR